METIRWGILGAGHIAGKWASDLALVQGASLQAVWARDAAKATEFGNLFRAKRVARTLEELLSEGDLDAVYVATPHGRHRDDALACIEAGIPVLCEKAFALDTAQAKEMVDAASRRGVFLMEALWTQFLPSFQEGKRLLETGTIGQPLSITTDFGFVAPYAPERRLWDPAMGGGALLDIGLYPLFFARELVGPFEDFEVEWTSAPNGVDRSVRVRGRHRGGATSDSFATFDENTPCTSTVEGRDGSLVFERMFHTPTDLFVSAHRGSSVRIPGVKNGHGYQWETAHAGQCVREGLLESPVWPLSRTLELTSLLDSVRKAMRAKI